MRKQPQFICLAMLLSAAGTGWAETFTRGSEYCDFSVTENYYREDLGNQVFYAACLIIKDEDSKGLPMLYDLASAHQCDIGGDA